MIKKRSWVPWAASLMLAACGGGVSTKSPPVPSVTAPSITQQPADQSVTVGQTATFSVTADGTAPFSYQWQKNSTAIAGATSASYTTPAAATGDSASLYAVIVSNSAGSVTSASAKLTVAAAAGAPTITLQPTDQGVVAGQSATFSVTAAGTAPLSYQWQKNSTALPGATSAAYTTAAAAVADSGAIYTVIVSNAAGSVTSQSATLTVTATASAPSITVQPADQSVTAGQTATFSVTASGTSPLSYRWQKNAASIAGAASASYTTPATATTDSGAVYAVVVSNATGSVTSRSAKLTVAAAAAGATDVLMYKNDMSRSGLNAAETTLTLSNVASASFGLLRNLAVDGKVDAQPLYVAKLTVAGASHNVVYAATEHGTVYAFDSDSGATLWHVSLLAPGESSSDTLGCGQVVPEIGVTSTPVINRSAGAHGTIYVVGMSKDASGGYHQRLHALDLTTGTELLGGPAEIAATFTAANGVASTFDAQKYEERAALLLLNGVVYTSWTSHCDSRPYYGWVIAYSGATLARSAVLNVAANSGGAGPAIWMAGGGLTADSTGNIYLLTGNGTFETTLDSSGFPNKQDYGNSFLKLSTAGGSLQVADYFAMYNAVSESGSDLDLGSGGGMLLPDLTDATGTVRQLMVGAGKDGNLYVVRRDSLGKFDASGNSQIWQELSGALPGGVWSTPAYFNKTVYYGDVGQTLKAFSVTNAKLVATPQSKTATMFAYPGTAPSVSANGAANGIVWAHENSNPAVLHAYEAANLAHELYNSSQATNNRDQFGAGNKYITPTVADGKVFVGTTAGVAVFGLLH